jgi:hypothetical protein
MKLVMQLQMLIILSNTITKMIAHLFAAAIAAVLA